jgi:hypothetical protein
VSWARPILPPTPNAGMADLEEKRLQLNDALERARLRAEEHVAARTRK